MRGLRGPWPERSGRSVSRKKRIGILTGGGDVPGLNAVIKSVVYRSTAEGGFEVLGLRRGWEGLTHLRLVKGVDRQYLVPLDRQNTRIIDRAGGTFLHTSRTNPSKLKVGKLPPHVRRRIEQIEPKNGTVDATPLVLDNLQKLNIDHLVAIGGDDTLSYASVLARQGVNIVAVPKTMDNDVRNTEYCIGFSTAMTRALNAITRLRTTLGSHERIGLIRMFGRDAGFTAFYTAYVASTRCCIPEAKFDLEKLIHTLVKDKANNPSRYALCLFSEGAAWTGGKVKEYGAADAYGHKKKVNVAEAVADKIRSCTSEDTTVSDLTYDLRSGEPDFLDKMVAATFATMAFECLADGARGRMTAIQNGCYTDADIPDPALGPRHVDVETMYDEERFRPKYESKKGLPIFMMKA